MSMKVKKGWLAVQVGSTDEGEGGEKGIQRFVIPISYLYNPLLQSLLERAREVYGYHADGPLRLPCSVDDFLHIRWLIEKEAATSAAARNRHDRYHHHLPTSLSFHSC
ncbi:unnamed protein product [Cuscuta epithymum]|uniref:Uncharacterized protein n=1 Tax=Cuscuta epithymum TaxID=186058 RepID=A0AAV0G6N3_9ASTE|nr:unnamed protein product [Cuscuta epithymum]CAH9142908.1 unnamed protein product [Cuscuta epithymum]